MTPARARLAALALLAGTAGAGADEPAAPDPAEARLKAAGVDDALRGEVRRAVERGAAFLLALQRDHGGFPPSLVVDGTPVTASPYEAGTSALCALALRHTGLPAAVEAARRTREHVLRAGPVRETVETRTYEAGVVAMLLAAEDGAPSGTLEDLARRLAKWQRSSGWWDYGDAPSDANLSTTQFGALGLWAAVRSGVEVPGKAWRALANAHLGAQGGDGRWGYEPTRPRDAGKGPSPYPQGTFMGLSNLLLAEAALAREGKPDAALAARVAQAKKKALAALDLDGPAFLATVERGARSTTYSDLFAFSALYALERACVLAGLETVGGARWYERGARLLVAKQGPAGSWPPLRPGAMRVAVGREWVAAEPEDERVRTAFALLFLLRVPEVDRPAPPTTTPTTTSPDAPVPPPTTPGR